MGSAFAVLLEGGNLLFSAALALMLLIGVVEALGLGGSAIDLDIDADASPLGWLGLGRLPVLVVLVVFLAAFGIIGIAVQQVAATMSGGPLPLWLAVPAAATGALVVTAATSRGLARILPRDETTAIDIDELVGRRATIVTGRAAPGSPARARVRDHHGHDHYVMTEPDNPGQSFGEGEGVLLVRRQGQIFRAIGDGRALLPGLDGVS